MEPDPGWKIGLGFRDGFSVLQLEINCCNFFMKWGSNLRNSQNYFREDFQMSHAKEVTLSTFEQEVLQSGVPVVVDFYADWCAPCRLLGPVLDRISNAYEGKAKVVKVNVDREPHLASHFRVSSIPTLMFVNHGEIVGLSSGLASEAAISNTLEKLVQVTA